MAKRTYIATIEIEADNFHQPWVFEHSIAGAVQDISGGKVTASVAVLSQERANFVQRLLTRLGAWAR